MSLARIAPGTRQQLGWINALIARTAGRVTRTEAPKLFTTLGRRRWLFRGWLLYSATMMPFGRLTRQETELVILRIANERDCAYERAHHERIARAVGVSEADIGSVRTAEVRTRDNPRLSALLAAATQFARQRHIDDTTWLNLQWHVADNDIIELVMLCAHYDSLATVVLTLGIQPDEAHR